MGEAKLRGSFEERKKQAIERKKVIMARQKAEIRITLNDDGQISVTGPQDKILTAGMLQWALFIIMNPSSKTLELPQGGIVKPVLPLVGVG